MGAKKLRAVSLDEVRITRHGDSVHFEYADPELGSMTLRLDGASDEMTDLDLLEQHNDVVLAMQAAREEYTHLAVEVPPGSPQIRYFARGDQWVPRGDVLRCLVHDGGPDGEVEIHIDDRALSLREFGRLLTTYAGWGMRLVFVPDDELHEEPSILVQEPQDSKPPPEATIPSAAPPPARAAMEEAPRSSRTQPASREWTDRDRLLLRRPVYRLRVTLRDTDPPIWRRILVSGNRTLKRLHEIIQIAMGWTNSHLHLFADPARGLVVTDPRFELEEEVRDEGRVKLRSFAPGEGSCFRYEYDFGDGWEHDVVVEAILPPDEAGRTPRCTGGEGACPPEDCGGFPGYRELVAAMRDPGHSQHEFHREWLGYDFDPEALDIDAINRLLRRIK